jgi:hypothetical protein
MMQCDKALAAAVVCLCACTAAGVVEDTRPDEGKVLVRPDMMQDQVVELELAEVQKKFNVSPRQCGGTHCCTPCKGQVQMRSWFGNLRKLCAQGSAGMRH